MHTPGSSGKEHASLGAVINRLIAQYEEAEFRRAVHESLRELRENPAEREAYLADLRAWNVTLMDGLEDEPPYEDDET